jgi:hypothetical protein
MTERAKVAGRTIQWIVAWLLLLAGITGMCATTYKNAYIIALWVLGMLAALIWMLTLRLTKTRATGANRE